MTIRATTLSAIIITFLATALSFSVGINYCFVKGKLSYAAVDEPVQSPTEFAKDGIEPGDKLTHFLQDKGIK